MESSEKLLKQILSELQAIRRNQEATMPAGAAEKVKEQRLPESAPDSEHERVNRKLSGLKSKGG